MTICSVHNNLFLAGRNENRFSNIYWQTRTISTVGLSHITHYLLVHSLLIFPITHQLERLSKICIWFIELGQLMKSNCLNIDSSSTTLCYFEYDEILQLRL